MQHCILRQVAMTMSPLELPISVSLALIDLLLGFKELTETEKITLIQGVFESRRRVVSQRNNGGDNDATSVKKVKL